MSQKLLAPAVEYARRHVIKAVKGTTVSVREGDLPGVRRKRKERRTTLGEIRTNIFGHDVL